MKLFCRLTLRFLAILVCWGCLLPQMLHATVGYSIIAIPWFPDGQQSYATGINSNNQIACTSAGTVWRPFLWDGGVMTECPPLAESLGAHADGGISNYGDMVGRSGVQSSGESQKATFWKRSGGSYTAVPLPGLNPDQRSIAYDITPSGDKIVGEAATSPGVGYAILWSWSGSSWVLNQLPGGQANANAINASGTVICGSNSSISRACVWNWSGSSWVFTSLGNPLDNNKASWGMDINGAGDKAVGMAEDSIGRCIPILWEYTAQWTARTLSTPGGNGEGEVDGISPDGSYLVGTWKTGAGWFNGCLWKRSGTDYIPYDIAALGGDPAWYIRGGRAVNDNGWVVGQGDYNDKFGGFLLIPDNQPPSVPTNVSANGLTVTSIRIVWAASTDNVGVTGYKVYRNGVLAGTSATTEYIDVGLQPTTPYSYTVSAFDEAGNSSPCSSPPVVAYTLDDTEPPSVPSNVRARAEWAKSIQVTWTASTDNAGVTGYKIYRNGSQIGTSPGAYFNDTAVQVGPAYSYRVSAYDLSGNNSGQSSPPAVVTIPSTLDFCSLDLGSTNMPNLLFPVVGGDGDTAAALMGGLNCRRPVTSDDQFFYFNIDDSYIYDGSTPTTYLEVCYYDDQPESVFLQPQYDSEFGEYAPADSVYFTNTGKWKTASWILTNCKFANRQNRGADFRLYVGPNNVKVDSVRVSRIPYTDHTLVKRDLGVNELYGGLSHPQHTDGDTAIAYTGGRYCRKPMSSGDEYLYFNISDAVMYGLPSSTIYLKVEYYDAPGGLIEPQYDSSTGGGYASGGVLNFTGTNTWREIVWELKDVLFANRQNAGADFRLYVGAGQNVFVDVVTVSNEPFTEDTQPPSVPTNVAASGQSSSTIQITWSASTDNRGVAGYKIYRYGNLIDTSSVSSYLDTELQRGTSYVYTVSAYDSAGNESAQSAPTIGSTTCDVVDLGVLSGTYPYSEGIGLSNLLDSGGQTRKVYIAGSSRTSGNRMHAVRWIGEWTEPHYWSVTISGLEDTEPGLAADVYARGISADGNLIVTNKASVYKYNGSSWAKDTLAGNQPAAYGIDSLGGRIVGSIIESGAAHGAVWTWGGSTWSAPVDLGTVGVASSTVTATSTEDRLCGYRYKSSNDCYQGVIWKWSGSTWIAETTFGDLVTGGRTYAWCINSDGTKAVGESGGSAFAWEWNGTSWVGTNLGTLGGGGSSVARGINSDDQIIGYAYDAGGQQCAVRWVRAGSGWQIQNLNDLVTSGSGWNLKTANAINDSGWITGAGTNTGSTRGFLFQVGPPPDTEPPSIPVNVQAIALVPTAIELTWQESSDNTGVTGYRLYRNGSEVGTTEDTSYIDTSLTPGAGYYYTVRAFDAAGNTSPESSPAAECTTIAATALSDVKSLLEGAQVGLVSQIVTAVFNGYFYISDGNRCTGIRVSPITMPESLLVGDTVDISGEIHTLNGERQLIHAILLLSK